MQLSDIKGIGEKSIAALNKAGFFSPADLLKFFPIRYVDFTALTDLTKVTEGDFVAILARAEKVSRPFRVRRGLTILKIGFIYDDKKVTIDFFNQEFMAKNISEGSYYYIAGRLKCFKSSFSISNPLIIPFNKGDVAVYPIYRNIKGVKAATIRSAIEKTIHNTKITSSLTEQIYQNYSLLDINSAVRSAHFPSTLAEAHRARYSLSVEELSVTLAMYSVIRKANTQKREKAYGNVDEKMAAAIKSLPFNLTESQNQTLQEIIGDLNHETYMNRLVQGDVGSGKTIVAMLAMYYVHLSGYSSAFMAPTELLAVQHYKTAIKFFEPLGVKCGLLTGSMTKKQRDTMLFNIENNLCDFVFGTHSLLNSEVKFTNLALSIIDEQQRFGVAQRGLLENKAEGGDVLILTATPIPRTLALAFYGELSQSKLNQKPAARGKIVTKNVPFRKEDDMWVYLKECAERGEQSYVVCPRIVSDDESVLTAAEDIFKKRKTQFPDGTIELIHGQIKDAKKNEIMTAFDKGDIKVLVSTTVIEVGIDVKNAVNMVIYDAERYGLSQLHQLRGRVGRGERDGYCFILSNNQDAAERLLYFGGTSDGFELAEYDFSTRGAGDFLGENQHGSGSFVINAEILKTVREIADMLLSDPISYKKLQNKITKDKQDFYENITLS